MTRISHFRPASLPVAHPGTRPFANPAPRRNLRPLTLLALATAIAVSGCGTGNDREQAPPPPGAYDTAAADLSPYVQPGAGHPAADLFPATATRGMVLNRCTTCHAAGCLVVGRRSAAEWRRIEASHADAVPGLSIEDRGRIFDFLRRNYDDRRPEPSVPAELLEGCPRR